MAMTTEGLPGRRAALALLLLIVLAAASRLWLLPIHYSSDPNEGWNAYHAVRAMSGGPLYPPPGALIGNNYPPLSFYAVGVLGRLVGDPIVAGRLVSLASVLGIAALLPLILKRVGASGAVSAAGALLFLLLNATVLRKYFAFNDPQWLGHLLMAVALLVVLPSTPGERPTSSGLVAASVLMLLGGLMKLNLVAWPLAVTVWLAVRHPQGLRAWIVTGVAGLVLVTAACWFAFGPDFFTDAFEAARLWSFTRIIDRGWGALLVMLAMIGWSWPFLRQWGDDSRRDLVRLCVLVSVPLGIVERGGSGVDVNAHFEAAIALCLACALALDDRRGERFDRAAGSMFVAVLLGIGFLYEARECRDFPVRYASWEATRQRIASLPGDVACESQALCFWAGKPFALDFFLYSQRARKAGAAPELDRALAGRRFSAAEIDAGRHGIADRASDPVLRRLQSAMTLVSVDAEGRRLLMPKR